MDADRDGSRQLPTLLYAVKQLELAVRAQLDELLRPAGVTTTQYTALTVLERHNDITSATLARNSFVTAQTMGDIVVALEKRGLVVRQQDPRHARRLTMTLTAQGRELLAKVRPAVAALESHMVEGLAPRDQEMLRGALLSCSENLRNAK